MSRTYLIHSNTLMVICPIYVITPSYYLQLVMICDCSYTSIHHILIFTACMFLSYQKHGTITNDAIARMAACLNDRFGRGQNKLNLNEDKTLKKLQTYLNTSIILYHLTASQLYQAICISLGSRFTFQYSGTPAEVPPIAWLPITNYY